jgi:hypothetical protein
VADEKAVGALFPDLPIHVRRCDPLGISADCKQVCTAADGSDYAIKEMRIIETMPHNEWLCGLLAERVGIATPTGKIVVVQGVNCFGSRWLAGEEADWWLSAQAGKIAFNDLSASISRILAFDLFVHNGDRHGKNYFVFQQKLGHAVLAHDFGRAWLYNGWPLPALPMNAASNTISGNRTLRTLFGDFIEISEVESVCDKLKSVTAEEISQIIGRHPKEWLKQDAEKAIIDWWNDAARIQRIESIEKGIKDGSFL